MTEQGTTDRGQQLGPAAASLVAGAEREARALGHDLVGTEHLLLALLTDETTPVAAALTDAGATRAAARDKVREARRGSGEPGAGPLPLTDRADRALGRSVRFARDDRAEAVDAPHVLLGVLDVEGTAGQVLRGLGVDVHAVRSSLDGSDQPVDAAPPGEPMSPAPVTIVCPACRGTLDDGVVHRTVGSVGTDGPRSVVVVACRACGAALGTVPG